MKRNTIAALAATAAASALGGRIVAQGAIGYIAANINTGKHKFWSFEHAYTKGKPGKGSVEQAFLDYAVTAEVQGTLLPALGYLQVSQLSKEALKTHPLPGEK